MRHNENISEDARRAAGEAAPIEDRMLDGGDRNPRGMEAAAEEAFVEDQRENPDHPARRQRRLEEDSGTDNPSHSRGI